MVKLTYAALVAKECSFVAEALELHRIASIHGMASRVEPTLERMIADWERKFPRLSLVLKGRC